MFPVGEYPQKGDVPDGSDSLVKIAYFKIRLKTFNSLGKALTKAFAHLMDLIRILFFQDVIVSSLGIKTCSHPDCYCVHDVYTQTKNDVCLRDIRALSLII